MLSMCFITDLQLQANFCFLLNATWMETGELWIVNEAKYGFLSINKKGVVRVGVGRI